MYVSQTRQSAHRICLLRTPGEGQKKKKKFICDKDTKIKIKEQPEKLKQEMRNVKNTRKTEDNSNPTRVEYLFTSGQGHEGEM